MRARLAALALFALAALLLDSRRMFARFPVHARQEGQLAGASVYSPSVPEPFPRAQQFPGIPAAAPEGLPAPPRAPSGGPHAWMLVVGASVLGFAFGRRTQPRVSDLRVTGEACYSSTLSSTCTPF